MPPAGSDVASGVSMSMFGMMLDRLEEIAGTGDMVYFMASLNQCLPMDRVSIAIEREFLTTARFASKEREAEIKSAISV